MITFIDNLRHKKMFLILMSFVVLSIFSVIFIWINNKIYFIGDSYFHVERLVELIRSKYLFPRYALNTFNYYGSSVMTMYPYILLYPTAILFFIIKSLKKALFVTFIVYTFITLMISFFSSLRLTRNRLMSYIFSIIYSLSGEFTLMYFNYPDMGVYFSVVFLPLIIFGFIYYLKYNKWIMLSVGMSLLLYSNIISFVFTSLILVFWLLINYRLLNCHKIFLLVKPIIMVSLTTAFIWLPIARMILLNNLSIPTDEMVQPISLFKLIKDSLNNISMNNQSLTIYSLLGLIIGGIFFKKSPRIIKQLYLLSIFIILFSSNLFPWYISSNNFILFKILRVIQFTIRLMVIPQLLLEFILSFYVTKIIKEKPKYLRYVSLAIIVISVSLIQLSGQGLYANSKNSAIHPQVEQPVLYNKDHTMKDPLTYTNNMDYWPKATLMDKHYLYNNYGYNKTFIHFIPKGNGVFYFRNKVNLNGRITLPFIYYYGTDYKCYLDNKFIKINPTSSQLSSIKKYISKGTHKIQIRINDGIITYISEILTIIGLLIYVYLLFYNKILNKMRVL